MHYVRITETAPLGGKLRGLPKVTKAAMQGVVVEWHHGRKVQPGLKGHFASIQTVRSRYPEAAGKGLFKARGAKYARQKAVRRGHARILEYTGATKRAVSLGIRVTGTSKRVRGTMTGGQALNFRGRATHDLRGELLAVNAAEERAMADMIGEEIRAFLNARGETTVTKE